jgi:SAM-dependent methyltransferase
MDRAAHWDRVYQAGGPDLSWRQAEPEVSLALIGQVCPQGRVIDIGGGTSPLPARLLDRGYAVAVLDISPDALERARGLLGSRAGQVRWIAADVTRAPDIGAFDVWHDRAAFHFLTGQADRAAYVDLLSRTLPAGGHAIIATFAPQGPARCSGLDVRRYDAPALAAELGPGFELLHSVAETHVTPWGARQPFQYSLLRRA